MPERPTDEQYSLGMLLFVLEREATAPSLSGERQNRGRVAGQTEVKLRGRQLHQLVDVHLGGLVLCCPLLLACRCGFVWVGLLVLCSLLPVDRPVLRLLLLRRLHLGLGFGHHGVTGCIQLLNREKQSTR